MAEAQTGPTPTHLFIQWSDDGQHIRKWSGEAFEGGVEFARVSPPTVPVEDALREAEALAEHGLTDNLERRALEYAERNAIAVPGDFVETQWGEWKRPRRVRIVSVGAHLIADWSQDRGFFLDFDMTYVAHRIRKNGSSAEKVLESGICLKRLTADDGRAWVDRSLAIPRNATWFNHCALSWTWRKDWAAAITPSAGEGGK